MSPSSARLLGPFTVQNLAFIMLYVLSWAFQVALVIQKLPANAGDLGSVPGSGRSPGGGHGNPLQYSYGPYGQRSLVDYSPWGRKESDMTERQHTQSWLGAEKMPPLMDLRYPVSHLSLQLWLC